MLSLELTIISLAAISAALVTSTGASHYGITVVIKDYSDGVQTYVTTSDTNYAISGAARLSKVKDFLDLLSKNDDSVFGCKTSGDSFTASYKNLEHGEQESIREVKSIFNKNLVGLQLTNPKRKKQSKSNQYYSSISNLDSYYVNHLKDTNVRRCNRPYSYFYQTPQEERKSFQLKLDREDGNELEIGINQKVKRHLHHLPQNLLRVAGAAAGSHHLQNDKEKRDDSGVFHFDTNGCPLDIYSSSYSVQVRGDLTVVYNRDATIYMYSKPHLSYDISWFLAMEDRVFFVYVDGTVLAKLVSQLDQTELELLIASRDEVKNFVTFFGKGAAGLLESK